MGKIFMALALGALTGCAGMKRSDNDLGLIENSREESLTKPPAYALPGVPLQSDLEKEHGLLQTPVETKPAEAKPAEVKPAEAKPAEVKPAAAQPPEVKPAAEASGAKDLAFHLAAAKKYAAKKSYRSAAAEYGAAIPFLPAGDEREIYLLERQGAMDLRAGDTAKAQTFFLSAISRAKDLQFTGNDVSSAYLGLGYCQEKAGKVQDAIASYEKAKEFSSSPKIKARIDKTISGLKKAP